MGDEGHCVDLSGVLFGHWIPNLKVDLYIFEIALGDLGKGTVMSCGNEEMIKIRA